MKKNLSADKPSYAKQKLKDLNNKKRINTYENSFVEKDDEVMYLQIFAREVGGRWDRGNVT